MLFHLTASIHFPQEMAYFQPSDHPHKYHYYIFIFYHEKQKFALFYLKILHVFCIFVYYYAEDGFSYSLVFDKESGEIIETTDYDGFNDYTEITAAVHYCDRKKIGGGYTVDNYRSGVQ